MRVWMLAVVCAMGCAPDKDSDSDSDGDPWQIEGVDNDEGGSDEGGSDDSDPDDSGTTGTTSESGPDCAAFVEALEDCFVSAGLSPAAAPVDLDHFCEEVEYGGLEDMLECHIDVLADADCSSPEGVNDYLYDLAAVCT